MVGRFTAAMLTVLALSALVFGSGFVGSAVAHQGPEVGASGNCADGEHGGGGELVYEVGTVPNPDDDAEVEGLAAGAGWFVESVAVEGNGPENACESNSSDGNDHSKDWAEVHAHDGGYGASSVATDGSAGTLSTPNYYQVCYDGQPHVVVANDPACPTRHEDR